jgi:rhamnulokinase
MNILAFDYGASSGRGILGKYDGTKLMLDEIHRFDNDPVMVNGTFYWDILRLFYELKTGLNKACLITKDIKSIGIDTWGVDFGLLDKKGRLLQNPVHYRDSRTENIMDEVFSIIPKEELYNETGIAFHQFNTLYQLFSILKNDPEQLEKADCMLFVPDLLRYFLTGIKNTEFTIASTSQLLEKTGNTWSEKILEKLNLKKGLFTDIVPAGSVQGELSGDIAIENGLGNVPVIAVAEHDTGSAVMSVPAKEDDFLYISSGTWSLIGVESEKSYLSKSVMDNNFTNEGGYGYTNRLLKNVMGLWIYQECRRDWAKKGESVSFDEVDRMIEKERPLRSFINPNDQRFFKAGDMPSKIVSYCTETGQEIPETKGQIVLCILQSLAMAYRNVSENLEKILGKELESIYVVGGGCKDKILCQFTANATGKRVQAGPVEATATGNLLAQLTGIGELKTIQEGRELVRNSFEFDEYMPENTELWNEAYERYLKII